MSSTKSKSSENYLYTLALFFDTATEENFRQIWADVATKAHLADKLGDLKNSRPHISLGAFNEGRIEQVSAALAVIADEESPFPLRFDSIGIFDGSRGVPFFGPAVNRRLLNIHRKTFERVNPWINTWDDFYLPERLSFHCSINLGLEKAQLLSAAKAALDTPVPILSKIESIGILKQPPGSTNQSFQLSGVDHYGQKSGAVRQDEPHAEPQ